MLFQKVRESSKENRLGSSLAIDRIILFHLSKYISCNK